ncbi:hypothetical protein [Nostoc sp. MG11]|uniref:hypothetical protein n=1 Tax=Nostoc sp. MG11 TaxID=2721166 RepID=UPI0018669BBA|nr:hypothetical protein [Nostoc sp. MG11]
MVGQYNPQSDRSANAFAMCIVEKGELNFGNSVLNARLCVFTSRKVITKTSGLA